ncbi:hypothetical protein BHE74_00038229 [Ensete ventricosum]|nr:hypothetical protein GW17_00026370 [Ensete ventricosum]RWW55153.1 hypothetical protein BHE74_00038229 [Ensete ventricosum]RZS14759.1 hypothetical protein BHM03_00046524 [Ensete ventricosum]
MASRAFLLALTISSLFLVHAILASASTVPNDRGNPDLDAEDLSFLEEEVEGEKPPHTVDFYPEDDTTPVFDETDVVVLGDGNFSEFMGKHRHVMVEFYVPWCEHCKALAPEYAAAATALRGEDVVLAKVDATKANVLAQKYDLQGYPTVLFFGDGVHKDYPGHRNRDAIVAWIKKKIGLGVQNITTAEEAEKILTSESRLVLAFLDSLVGSDSQELSAASKLEDNINFYQTVNPDVAQLFHIDADAKRPSLVLLKKEADKISYYEPAFSKLAKLLRGVESLVIAKMEGTRNEHPHAKVHTADIITFTCLYYYHTGFVQMLVDTDGTLKALYKFIKKHAKIPFKIERPASVSQESVGEKSAGTGVKEEL